MRIGDVDFPEPLLNALRDGELVIFAGAGVSMGEPANLPSFKELAHQIGQRRNEVPQGEGSEDRFLGNLKDNGVEVHKIAAGMLDAGSPTELHTNLLKLYANDKNPRIVTTNFDLLFGRAVDELTLPNLKPEIFRAPALPLGERFQGIVHVHGAITRPEDMILTDKDFGRAYLTERVGWATRFLVELFNKFTVLFIGYSHDDIIMNYLARALPAGSKKRYVLMGSLSSDSEIKHWHELDIKPIVFQQSNGEDYQSLDEAICKLAQHVQRGLLDWQSEITRIAKLPPPVDKATADIIEYALQDEIKTRFFTKAATSDKWIGWLDDRKHLDPLFKEGNLTEKDKKLSQWLAGFACESANSLFLLIGRHDMTLNPEFSDELAWAIVRQEEPPDRETLSRWVSLLVRSMSPNRSNSDVLLRLAVKCVWRRIWHLVLQIYDLLASSRPYIRPSFGETQSAEIAIDPRCEQNHYLTRLWKECLKPYREQLAAPLLQRTVVHLETNHWILCDWQQADRDYCLSSLLRAAIAPHKKNRDDDNAPLIDIARDCLEWLVQERQDAAGDEQINVTRHGSLEWLVQERQDAALHWADQQANADTPLLRRLAVHAISESDLDANAKIAWLLKHMDIHECSAKPEIFRLARKAYPKANQAQRKALIKTVLDYRWPKEDDQDQEDHTAYIHFNWLYWLNQAGPDCPLVKQPLEKIKTAHPDFEPQKYPDLNFWAEEVPTGLQSPWSVNELLAKPAADWLPKLLAYQPADRRLFGPNREGLLMSVTETIRNKPVWGFNLADRMAATKEWNTDLWQSVLRAWSGMELKQDDLHEVFRYLAIEALHQEHARGIAEVLYRLIEEKDKQAAMTELLPQANAIATKLWHCLNQQDPPVEEIDGWLTWAINHPAGNLASFWLHSIELWRRQHESKPQRLNDEYRTTLSSITQNRKIPGKLGCTVLASYFHFLLAADGAWTRENLLPLFDPENENFKPAWDGFLWGIITPDVAEIMQQPFMKTARYMNDSAGSFPKNFRRERFIEYYTDMLNRFATGPDDQWITNLLRDSNNEVRRIFAQEMWHLLCTMNETQRRESWQRWLKGYWENRLHGTLATLDDKGEVGRMLAWVFYLPDVFPDAVDLAVKMPPVLWRSIDFHLRDSDVLQRHPEALAKLVIYIGKGDEPQIWWDAKEKVIDPLLQSDIPEKLKKGLTELIAKFDLR